MNMKKQARRERAAKRFTVLSFSQFRSQQIGTSSPCKFDRFEKRCPGPSFDHGGEYRQYVERKNVEAAALGIPRSLPA